MDILVTKRGNYYNFFSAEKEGNVVYLYELQKDLVKKFAIGGRTQIKPIEKCVNRKYKYPLVKSGSKHYIMFGEVIERYDPNKQYINVFKV